MRTELDVIDMAVVELLLDRLPRQADNVEADGHLNAARYMRTTVRLLELLREPGTAAIAPKAAEKPCRVAPKRHEGYVSVDVPAGWQTVLGYLAIYLPEYLDTLDCSYPETTQRDGYKLAHWCKQEGYRERRVPAPYVLQAMGIDTVRAYPIALLDRRFKS